jgi:mannose-6-phosphate isomerase-like protein (cupin superfamily)
MDKMCVIPVIRSPQEYQTYRISPDATNRLAVVLDPKTANLSITYCIEIFDVGGKTPPNRHQFAAETFFVLKGDGIAICDGKEVAIHSGDTLLVPPTGIHEIHNTGLERLYLITVMVPNENFAELIRSGIPTELDVEDLAVLRRELV